MRDERHQRMLHRRHVPLHELLRRVAGPLMERGEHDVEPLENLPREIETAIGEDIDLAAVEDRDIRMLLPQQVADQVFAEVAAGTRR